MQVAAPFAWRFVESSEHFASELSVLAEALAPSFGKGCQFVTGFVSQPRPAADHLARVQREVHSYIDGRLPAATVVLTTADMKETSVIATCSFTAVPFVEVAEKRHGTQRVDSTALSQHLLKAGWASHIIAEDEWQGKPAEQYVELKCRHHRPTWKLVHTTVATGKSRGHFADWNQQLAAEFPPLVQVADKDSKKFIKHVEIVLHRRLL